MRSVQDLRANRYEMLRNVIARGDGSQDAPFEEQVRSVVVPPGSWCIGKCVDEVRRAGAQVAFTGIRRQGILGREPAGDMAFEDGEGWGNFPQTYSHVGLITAAMRLSRSWQEAS